MKALLYMLVLSLISTANTQLEVDRSTPLHSYNHKPSIKLKKQRVMRSLARINKNEAIHIAVSHCREDVVSSVLTNVRQLLFYRVYTQNCRVEINALDGAILSKDKSSC